MKRIRNHQLLISLLIFYIIHSYTVIFCISADSVICKLKSLQYLDLSNNYFHGPIPLCLGNLSSLVMLNLQKNNFSGEIPQTFNGGSLRTLDLSYNKLQGRFPISFSTCKDLEVLNVGHNSIADVFPQWLEFLPKLIVLVLRNNKFYGPIPPSTNASSFSELHIIDLSQNNFTGTLPSKNFENWHSMGKPENNLSYSTGSPYYSDSMIIINKGVEMELKRILIVFKAVDFSQNNFHGEIPMSIGRFRALRVLNLSRNALTGVIPPSLADLRDLESLDLSHNQLSGKIPNELTRLTFLGALDLSFNKLTGKIPKGGQFETFPNAFIGNPGLVTSPPGKNEKPTPSSKSRLSSLKFRVFKANGYGWEDVLVGYGCGLVLGLVGGCYLIWMKEEHIWTAFNIKGHAQRKSRKAKTHPYGKQK
ncbi:unnamed protein product [Thlaspi arvense]|uniref:Receptor-like protein 12 n=1 Tax=Thlaspi arvense TaxID=13288 RepID=A0AAU9RH66_THLAR|nr:unnamed protein product [Thlaspi arvense]